MVQRPVDSTQSQPEERKLSPTPLGHIDQLTRQHGLSLLRVLLALLAMAFQLSTTTNKPTSTLSILDAERLPEVQYATLQDMKKASSSLLHLIPDLYTQRGIPSTSLTDHWI